MNKLIYPLQPKSHAAPIHMHAAVGCSSALWTCIHDVQICVMSCKTIDCTWQLLNSHYFDAALWWQCWDAAVWFCRMEFNELAYALLVVIEGWHQAACTRKSWSYVPDHVRSVGEGPHEGCITSSDRLTRSSWRIVCADVPNSVKCICCSPQRLLSEVCFSDSISATAAR